jgi:two-component system chemotaxis response regulator CheY
MMAMKEKKPYDLICLDIMMPNVDGVKVLKIIRQLEEQNSIASNERCKVIMTTALADTQFVQNAFKIGCDAYAVKPIDTERLVEVMQKLGLLEDSTE